jgi:hypothetical protein
MGSWNQLRYFFFYCILSSLPHKMLCRQEQTSTFFIHPFHPTPPVCLVTSIPTPSFFLFCHLSSFVLKKGGKERQFYGSKCNYQASLWASLFIRFRRCNLLHQMFRPLNFFSLFYHALLSRLVDSASNKQIRLLCFRVAE